jgi:hypothetical protein
MANEPNHIFQMTTPAEFAFPPALYEKRAVKVTVGTAEPRWEAALLFPTDHPDLTPFKRLARSVVMTKVPGFTPTAANWKYPWRTGDEYIARQTGDNKYDNSFLVGKVLVNSHANKYPPKLSLYVPGTGAIDLDTDVLRDLHKSKFHAGALAICEFGLVCYHTASDEKPTVTAYLNHVLLVPGGEKRGGGKPTAEKFSAYLGSITSVNPTVGAEDF